MIFVIAGSRLEARRWMEEQGHRPEINARYVHSVEMLRGLPRRYGSDSFVLVDNWQDLPTDFRADLVDHLDYMDVDERIVSQLSASLPRDAIGQ